MSSALTPNSGPELSCRLLRYKELCRTDAHLVERNTSPYKSGALCKTSSTRNLFKMHSHAESSIAFSSGWLRFSIGSRNPSEETVHLHIHPRTQTRESGRTRVDQYIRPLGACCSHHGQVTTSRLCRRALLIAPTAALPTRAHCGTTMLRSRARLRCRIGES